MLYFFFAKIDLQSVLEQEQQWYREFFHQNPWAIGLAFVLYGCIFCAFAYLLGLLWKKLLKKREFLEGEWGNILIFLSLLFFYIFLQGLAMVLVPESPFKLYIAFWVSNFLFCMSLIFCKYKEPNAKMILGFGPFSWKAGLAAVLGYILFLPIFLASYAIAHIFCSLLGIQPQAQKIAQDLLVSQGTLFYVGAATAILGAPLFEEFIFRVFIYSYLRKALGVYAAILLSSFFFSLVHFNIFALFPIFLLGIFFAILYEKTQSLLVPVIAHACHNTLTLLYLLLFLSLTF